MWKDPVTGDVYDDDEPGDGFTGECSECGKDLHPDEYEAEVCDSCAAELECE